MNITIGYLYGDLMNIYGDTGNITALKKRAQWKGIEVSVKNISVGDSLKKGDVDIFFFGGGQDQSQEVVAEDLQKKAGVIKAEVERGVPLLAICGGYQLLGEFYRPHEGPKLPGIEVFPAYTEASFDRMIGNIVIKVHGSWFMVHGKKQGAMNYEPITNNNLVGFENHSGKTWLKDGAQPLGEVVSGFGNNGEDKTEGCIYKNAIGCYMHGSLLPKNPHLADWLLQKALEVKFGEDINLKKLDDELEEKAHQNILKRFNG